MKNRKLYVAFTIFVAFTISGIFIAHWIRTRATAQVRRVAVAQPVLLAKQHLPPARAPERGSAALSAGASLSMPGPSRAARQPLFKPRKSSEWQGMRVDLSVAPTCERTERCSLAQTCKAGRCLPCENDGECLTGEICVLDHCVRRELAKCRTAVDCKESLCLLTGYAKGPRNNDTMSATCADLNSGAPETEEEKAPEARPTEPRPPSVATRLLARLKAADGGL